VNCSLHQLNKDGVALFVEHGYIKPYLTAINSCWTTEPSLLKVEGVSLSGKVVTF